MSNRYTTLVITLVFATGSANAAGAQDAPIDFARLNALTRPGDTVHITDPDGRDTKWKLSDMPLELLMQRAGISSPEVQKVALERPDSPWNGALIGLAVTGVPWLAVCAANDWCYYNEYGAENMLRTTALVTAGIGAGIGALIDLSKRMRTTIYRASGDRALNLAISPAFSSEGATVRVSVIF